MFHNPMDNRSLYNVYDFTMRCLQPYSDYCQTFARKCRRVADTLELPLHIPYLSPQDSETYKEFFRMGASAYRRLAGYSYVSHMLTNVFDKPHFNIEEVKIDDAFCAITEDVIDKRSFCNLLRFRKAGDQYNHLPTLLLVAPLSGHYATLLRDTIVKLLPYYDVYITDWKNARDVPLIEGGFDLDDAIGYLLAYFELLGPDFNVMGVCQATVPVLASLGLMSTRNSPKLPHAAILLGGPIDTSASPTTVNEMATSRGDDWFQQNVISIVPAHFKGAMRLVYPGFMQLSGFMSMNLQRHFESLHKAIDNYSTNQKDAAFKTINFYLEYFATMDLTAEFYMQTIHSVFQEKLLSTGRLRMQGNEVRLQDIRNTAILAIEGSRDDITGVGQTEAVIRLCKNLSPAMKKYFLAQGVGHYGLFNGRKFKNLIIPEILAFTQSHSKW